MIPTKVVTSFEVTALYFVVNWASDQNNYIAAMLVLMVATMVMGVATKVATSKMAK